MSEGLPAPQPCLGLAGLHASLPGILSPREEPQAPTQPSEWRLRQLRSREHQSLIYCLLFCKLHAEFLKRFGFTMFGDSGVQQSSVFNPG